MSYTEEELKEDISILIDLGLVEMSFNEHFHPIYRITEKARQMTEDEIIELVAKSRKK